MTFSNQQHSLPPNYSAQFDAVQNRYFFINNLTGETSWVVPEAQPTSGSTGDSFTTGTMYGDVNPPPSYSDGPNSKPLPAGWISQFDELSKRPFFVNTVTNHTQWEDPRFKNGIPKVPSQVGSIESQATLFSTGALPPSNPSQASVLARNPVDGTYYYKPYNPPIIPNAAPIQPQKPPKKPGFFSAFIPHKQDPLQ